MNKKQLLDEFQVEELEKRFEMKQWISSAGGSVKTQYGTIKYEQSFEPATPPVNTGL